jgi:hypothetical protein
MSLEALQEEMADQIYQAIQTHSNSDERSQQAARHQVGVSELGWCSERTRRTLKGEDPADTDMMAAWLGTAIGVAAEDAVVQHLWPDAICQATVTLTLKGTEFVYNIPGHPDVIRPQGVLLDFKTNDGLMVAERTGMDERQKKFQRHGYALAAFEAGLFDDGVALDDVLVGNCWIDRSGSEKRVLVRLEKFDHAVIDEILEWLEEALYAFKHETEARKEPPREMCAKTCGFYSTCRAYDTDTEGLLTDPDVLAAMAMYREGADLARLGEQMKKQAKSVLADTSGFALIDNKRFQLRWTHINESLTKPSVRRAYERLELKELP